MPHFHCVNNPRNVTQFCRCRCVRCIVHNQPRQLLQALGEEPMSAPAKLLALHAGMWADMFQELIDSAPRQV